MNSRLGMRLLKKAIFELPNSSISFQDWTSQITAAMNNIDTSFHFMDFFAVHPRIFYLFTKVNYTNFHVSLCFNIFYKDKKKQSTQTDNNTLIINNITNKQQGIV